MDRNIAEASASALEPGRSLRGNVDRNNLYTSETISKTVVPYVGTWIEIEIPSVFADLLDVVPYVGTWIEMCRPGRCA